jgi:hypothetical protein
MRWSVQAPRGTLRRLQPEPHPLGRLVLRCQHTVPKSRSFFRCSFSGPHHDPLLTLPYPPPTTPPSLTALPLNRRSLLGYIWVRGPQSLAANSTAFAALLYALVSDAEGPYLKRLSQRKPLSVSDICPAKLVTWHPVIPNGSYLLHGPRQTLPGCVLIAILGDPNRVRAGSAERTRLGDGEGSSYWLGGSGGRHLGP